MTLGPVTLEAGGVASVNGSVNADVNAGAGVNGTANAGIQVSVNGQAVGIGVNGQFSADVNLNAQGGINVNASDRVNGETTSITISASAIASAGANGDVLAQLNADAVTVMVPPDGFTSVDGIGANVAVHVAHIDGIASLQLNGADVLAQLKVSSSSAGGSSKANNPPAKPSSPPAAKGKPGSATPPAGANHTACRHTASRDVAGSAKKVKVTVTGTNGASQTTTFPVRRIRSVIRIGRQMSISAFGARGIRIAGIHFDRRGLMSAHRLGVTVTVRDRRHYLVRDAVVMLQSVAHRLSINGSMARISDIGGRATFTVPIATRSLGLRLYVAVVARTPWARTHVTASTALVASGTGAA